jgi:hypothetical protein
MMTLACCFLAAVPSLQEVPPLPDVPYAIAAKPWPSGLGNHRAVVRVDAPARAVRAFIPWRRRDRNPEAKDVIVVDLATGTRVRNVARLQVRREFGEIAFQPASAPGDYGVYYLPYPFENDYGGYYLDYDKPSDSADPAWRAGLNVETLPKAKVVRFEDRTQFDSMYPMVVVAMDAEVAAMTARYSQPYLVFPEDRSRPIQMADDLPLKWVRQGPGSLFEGKAMRNEYFAFQLGVYASRKDLSDLRVSFEPLMRAGRGKPVVIPASALRCYNLGGVDTDGKAFAKRVDIPKGRVQALWCGVDVPANAIPGTYTGTATVTARGLPSTPIALTLIVRPQILADRGDSEPWRHSRLRWLDSTAGIDDEIVAPYAALQVSGRAVKCLGREVVFGSDALPKSIQSGANFVLSSPLRFVVEGASEFAGPPAKVTVKRPGRVELESRRSGGGLKLNTVTKMEFDGTVNVRTTLEAEQPTKLKDVRLELPIAPGASTYFMGIGRPGGYTPEAYDWKWTGPQDSFWIGGVHAGVHCKLRGASYAGPMLNIYRPAPPESWGNGGLGGCRVASNGHGATVVAYSGPRTLKAGENVTFEFELLITPVKPLDTARHFKERYYHNGGAPAPTPDAVAAGVNVVNVHQGNDINPYINYPFVVVDRMKAFVDRWHATGMKVKIYYTVRELSNHVAEEYALRSLGTEILAGGSGGGFPWLREHLGSDYTPQWYTPLGDGEADAAILTSGESRWYNYYIEGLGWLVKNVGVDGLYLDDVTYDRRILKRMRKVMARVKPGCLIDLHSNTGFSIGPANQYTEYFPFVDRLWFGESFNYEAMPPEQWLVEVSGIPFGLMGDMLQGGGNRWRGMVHGMTVRLPWESATNRADPKPVWKLWDSFGIAGAKMIGYWEPDCPVRTGRADVLATAYVKKGQTLIALASWAKSDVAVSLKIDWKALGIDPSKAILEAPEVTDFQSGAAFRPDDPIPVSPGKGRLLIVRGGP